MQKYKNKNYNPKNILFFYIFFIFYEKSTMKVALCCIGRSENRYVVEYVEHYKNIGVDKIFIYDNNYDGEEYFEEVLQPYIDEGLVEITDFRNKSICQLESYQDCYDKHGNEYDWMIFADCGDEYLYMNDFDNVKDFLSQDKFSGYDCIHINWMTYGDNNLVNYDDRKLLERFVNPVMPLDFKKNYNFPENDHVKSIVRGGVKNLEWKQTPHTPSNRDLKCCDAGGKEQNSASPFIHPFDFTYAHFKHYTTKTIDEWVNIKIKRGYPDGNKDYFKTHNIADEFFKINEKTPEKIEFLKRNVLYRDNLDIFISTYKTFEPKVSNNVYKIVVGNHEIENHSNLQLIKCGYKDDILDDRFYSEIYMFKWLAENYPLKEYVGFCHYRKHFDFMDNIPDVQNILRQHDAILPKPINSKINMREWYKKCHNIDDLNIIENIIDEKFAEYKNAMSSFLYGKMMIPYNMFIMKRDDFLEYVNFISGVLDEYIRIVGTDIEKRIEDNKDKYFKNFYPNNTIEYQYRIGGYLAERLTSVFVLTKFKKVYLCDVNITEQKYGTN